MPQLVVADPEGQILDHPSLEMAGRSGTESVPVPAEDLISGPIGYRLQLVDYDATTRRFIGAHDLGTTGPGRPKTAPSGPWRPGLNRFGPWRTRTDGGCRVAGKQVDLSIGRVVIGDP